ncbi:MAG: hypothetical protein AAB930_01035 [Patescibacteria group bacterium]
MFKYLIATLCLIFAGLGGIYYFVGVPRIESTNFPALSAIHLYNNPDVLVDNIHISAFYFVSENKIGQVSGNWHNTMEVGLPKLAAFHELQFQKRSKISYAIYPEPVIGEKDNLLYDTENTGRGNPRALIAISEELERRVFKPDGDLYRKDFAEIGGQGYPVIFIMYEGVGATGGIIHESARETASEIAADLGLAESVIFVVDVSSADGFFILNRETLEGKHGPNGETIVAHEFYHTLGVEDKYSLDTGRAESADLMGLGRFKPLENTFLSKDTLNALGL